LRSSAYSNKLLVFSVFAVLSEDTKESFLSVEGFADFVKSLNKAFEKIRVRLAAGEKAYHR